jgi:hypothetical protein
VTKPSKLGPVFLTLFGLPFLGMGLFAAYTFLNEPNQPLPARIGAAIFASVFAVIGGGLIFGSFYGYALQKQQAGREQANPASPWLWRRDWAASRVESTNKSRTIGWWVAAILANMLFLPMSMGSISKGLSTRDPTYILPAALGLVGLLLLFGAIRATIRFERFGKTYFEMATLPFSPGSRVAGAIHIHLDTDVRHGVDLKLWCTRTVVTNVGKDRSSHKLPLWEESKNIPPTAFSHGPLDTIIPVEFAIPPDALQTDHDNPDDRIEWSLKVNANVPGVNYADEFEVPVFRMAGSPDAAVPIHWETNSSFQTPSDSQSLASSPASIEVPEPEVHSVAVADSAAGLRFHFRAGRNVFRAVLCVTLAAGCGTLLYAMLRMPQRQPIFALAIVGLLTFFLTLASIHSALTSTQIVVGNGVISWRHSVLGIGRTHQMRVADVAGIEAVTSIQQASSSGSTLYSLRLQTGTGKSHTLVDEIQSQQEACWIVSEIEKRSGLPLSTRVRMDDAFYGGPPQPGAPSANNIERFRNSSIRIKR